MNRQNLSRPYWAATVSMAVLAIAISAPEIARAQNAPETGDDGARHIERIVVTGTGVSSSTDETLHSVDAVVLDELLEDFSGSIGDTLAQLPGVSSTYFGPAAGRPVIRGLGGDRVRVLNNGVGLIDASTASPDHAVTAETLDAERVEILRGPAAIAYGGNAIGGVVNVIDGRIPTAPVDGGVDGQLVLGVSSVDDGFLSAGRIRTGFGQVVLQLEASRRTGDDYDIPGFAESALQRAMEEEDHDHDDEDHDHDEDHDEDHEDEHEHEEEEEAYGYVPNSDFEFTTIGAGGSFIADWGLIGVSVRQYDADYGIPGGHAHAHEEEEHDEDEDHGDEDHDEDEHDHEEEGDARIDMEQLRFDIRGEINVALGPFDRAEFSVGIADYEHAEIEGSGEVGTLFSNEGWESRVALRNGEAGDRWSGLVGLQASHRDFSAVGEEAFIDPVTTDDVGVFVAQRIDFGAWGLEGGARVERRDIEPTTGADRDFTMLSLSGGVFWRPSDDSFLGVSLSRTQRAPTDIELFGDGPHLATRSFEIGNPDLDLETALSMDVSYHHDHGNVSFDAAVFVTSFEDFIFLAPTADEEDGLPVFRFLQDDAMLWGGEFVVEALLFEHAGWAFSGDAAFDYVRAETDSLGNLPRIPPYSVTLGFEAERDILALRAEVEHVGEQDEVAQFELPTDDYTLVNLSATVRPTFADDVSVIFEARNVTDEEGRVHASALKDFLPLPGRNFAVRLSARF